MILVRMIISTLIQCLVGWIFIKKIPEWINMPDLFATILKIIGVIIIIRALIAWIY